MVDELNDDEQTLLRIIAGQANTIFSLDWLANKTDRSRESVEDKLISLEEKGYIRVKRLENAVLPSELSSQKKLWRIASNTFKTMEQIEQLWKKRKQAKRSVYKRVRSELLENLEFYMPQLEEATIEVERQLEKLDSQIKDVQEKISETKLGLQIDYIDESEAQRLLKSYEKERKDLLNRRRETLTMFMEPAAIESQKKELETEKDSLRYEVEVLDTKRLIGVIDEEEYKEKIAELDEETKKIVRAIEDQAYFNIEEAHKRLEQIGKTKAIPKKVHERVMKQFNKIRLLK